MCHTWRTMKPENDSAKSGSAPPATENPSADSEQPQSTPDSHALTDGERAIELARLEKEEKELYREFSRQTKAMRKQVHDLVMQIVDQWIETKLVRSWKRTAEPETFTVGPAWAKYDHETQISLMEYFIQAAEGGPILIIDAETGRTLAFGRGPEIIFDLEKEIPECGQ